MFNPEPGQPRPEFEIDRDVRYPTGNDSGSEVVISSYQIGGVIHFGVRPAGEPLPQKYDQQKLPELLFLGVAGLTLVLLIVLLVRLPDLLSRAGWVLRGLFRPRVHIDGIKNVPSVGPVLLLTNSSLADDRRSIIAATDRFVRYFNPEESGPSMLNEASTVLERGDVVALTIHGVEGSQKGQRAFLEGIRRKFDAIIIVPVFCGKNNGTRQVLFKEPLSGPLPESLMEWVQK
jgi:hypothetical protein